MSDKEKNRLIATLLKMKGAEKSSHNIRRFVGVAEDAKLSSTPSQIGMHTFKNPIDTVYVKCRGGDAVVPIACTLETVNNMIGIKGSTYMVDFAYPLDRLLATASASRLPQITTTSNVFFILNTSHLSNKRYLETWIHSSDPSNDVDVWTVATPEQLIRWGVTLEVGRYPHTLKLTFFEDPFITFYRSTIASCLLAEGLLSTYHHHSQNFSFSILPSKITPQALLDQERINNVNKSIYRYICNNTDKLSIDEVVKDLGVRQNEFSSQDRILPTDNDPPSTTLP